MDTSSALPKVSIITVCYNCKDTIEKTILSVIDQNFKDREYLVIDGGSSDGTLEILKKYDHAIDYWESKPDKGVYDAMNKGIDAARGQWIYFLGGDDRLYDENVLGRIFTNPIAGKMLYGNVLLVGNGPVGKDGKVYDGKFTKHKLCWKSICQQSIFYHKELFERLGLFDLQYPVLADRVFNMKVFATKGSNPCFMDTIIAYYSTEGLSGKIYDDLFVKDLPFLIKDIFGLRYYLWFITENYLTYILLRPLVKVVKKIFSL